MPSTLNEFVCERKLSLRNGGEVVVRLSAPAPASDAAGPGSDCFCSYQVTGIGDEKIRKTWGVDSFQAMQLVLMAIGTDLYVSDEARAGNLTWEGGNVAGDLGFPVPERLADLVPSGASIR